MKTNDELKFAQQGYELLDQKRNILVIELLGLVDQATDFEQQVRRALESAFSGLERAVMANGKLQVLHVAGAVTVESSIELRHRKVMGVRLPVVDTETKENPPYYSPVGTSFWVDSSIEKFKEALKLMGRLAELKVSIVRLAREVRRTIRKVNALERIAIPELEETVKVIQERLEENEREMFTLMKTVKNRLEQKELADERTY
jgi:V/A-type H+-transporting ATPase subunit D